MNYRKSRALMWAGFVFGAAVGIIAVTAGRAWLIAAMIVIMLVSLLQAAVFYRCPDCGKSLMTVSGAIPEHCPACGKELR